MRIKRGTPFELARVARDMRPEDRAECAAVGRTPLQGVLQHTGRKWVVVDEENRPICAFGVTEVSVQGGVVGSPWLFGTPLLKAHRHTLIRLTRPIVRAWVRQYHVLVNAVLARPSSHYRWLMRLGARFNPNPVEINGAHFHTFAIR